MRKGRTIEQIGDSGSGKTSQFGELAKDHFRKTRKKSILHTADRGGYDSIQPLIDLEIVEVDELSPDDDPWIWINRATSGDFSAQRDDIALEGFDSGSSIADVLMDAAAYADFQIGQQRTQKFSVKAKSSSKDSLTVALNNEAHYGLVQQFMLKQIRQSTYLINRGTDVLWNFVLFRGEGQDGTPILGPKLAGKALTPFLPKEFRYTFRLVAIPQDNQLPIHRLFLTTHPELAGTGHSFGNARYPLGADPLPPFIEPADIVQALELIEKGSSQVTSNLKIELGI